MDARRLLLLGAIIGSVAPLTATADTKPGEPDLKTFQQVVAPLLKEHCVRCHGPTKARGDVTLHDLGPNLQSADAAELWTKVAEQVLLREMPPTDQPRLSPADLQRLTEWIRREQVRVGREPTVDPTLLPGFGNYLDHDKLFTMPTERKAATPARLWRISPYIFKGTVNFLARIPVLVVKPNQGSDGLHPSLPFVTPAHSFRDQAGPHAFENATTELLFDMAWRVAGLQLIGRRSPHEFQTALAAKSLRAEQIRAVIRTQFALALQREPTDDEIRSLTTLAEKTAQQAGAKEAVQSLLAAVLMKPEAVFRSEIGQGERDAHGRVMLAPRELTYAIAFALTDQLPDETLRRSANEGKLQSADDVRREVQRLLHDETIPKPRILRFFQEYFEYPKVTQVFKDARNANATFVNERVADADALVLHILKEDRDVLKELLTTDRLFVMAKGLPIREPPMLRARKFYLPDFGMPSDWPAKDPQPLKPTIGRRSGILTHPAWLMAFSDNEKNQAIQRGHWIRTKLLGGTIPDVPIGVNAQFPADATLTLRQKMHVTREAYCWKCHQRMDELGLPFEQFDDFGRWRTVERVQKQADTPNLFRDVPVDTSGRVTLTGDPALDGPVQDPFELLTRLANSQRVLQVFIRHAFRYWLGRNETLDDAPTLIDAQREYIRSGGSMKALITSLLTSDSFLYRRSSEVVP